MKEHLKKIKETIDVARGYSLGTVFTTRNKQYMYDTGTGKVFYCGSNGTVTRNANANLARTA